MKKILRRLIVTCVLFSGANVFALNIALTNDDGWNAPGIQSLRTALLAAGHKVTLAGSSENQSGSSAAIDIGQANIVVTKHFEDGAAAPGGDQYSVALKSGGGAEPATAGQLAIAIAGQAGEPVDLLVSGINAGANIGAFTNLSGTVGAVINGISLASGSRVPAIAISTDEPRHLRNCAEQERAACEAANRQHFAVVAAWMTGFIAELEQKPGKLKRFDRLLPHGIALNINYPASDEIAGVSSNVQGLLPSIMGNVSGLELGCYADCVAAPVGAPLPAGVVGQKPVAKEFTERKHADTTAFNNGYVSVVVIDTDLTASKTERRLISRLVKNLNQR